MEKSKAIKAEKKQMIQDYGRPVFRAAKALTKAGESTGAKESRLENKSDRIIERSKFVQRADTPLAPTPEPIYRQ